MRKVDEKIVKVPEKIILAHKERGMKIYRICDLCKKEESEEESCNEWIVWKIGRVSNAVHKLEYGITKVIDGKEHTERHVIDICPKCFKDKLLPFLEKEGYKNEIANTVWQRPPGM